VALNLYRRHRSTCPAGHASDSRTGEFEERKKTFRRCDCLIFASGTINQKFARKCTDRSDWAEAKALAEAWERAGDWNGAPVPVASAKPQAAEVEATGRVSVADATQAFIVNREAAAIAPATLRKYRTFTKQLTAYSDARGYVMLDQFTALDADLFYAGLKLGPRAKGKRLGTLRAFFRFAVNRKWIEQSPVAADIKPPVGSSKAADKMPFTDEEIERIIAACDKPPRPKPVKDGAAVVATDFVGATWTNEQGDGEWTGEDLKDIIWLMLYTGYRISDAAFFDMSRLKGNQVVVRAQKNGRQVFGVLPEWLCERLRERAKGHGQQPFIVGRSTRLETVTNVWRRRLAKAFDAAGAFELTPTPHRFRHSFARILLQKGVSVADVAELMGDDEDTIRRHYAAWVPERQERLTRVLEDAFGDRPKLRAGTSSRT
jgi:integrase